MSLAPLSKPFTSGMLWRPWPWGNPKVVFAAGKTLAEARERCKEKAIEEGWTEPRRWQWWRASERSTPMVEEQL